MASRMWNNGSFYYAVAAISIAPFSKSQNTLAASVFRLLRISFEPAPTGENGSLKMNYKHSVRKFLPIKRKCSTYQIQQPGME